MQKLRFTREDARAALMVILGTAINAVGFSFITYPNSIVAGGVTGMAQIVNHFTALPVGAVSVVLNIPLFVFAWRMFGIKFILLSLLGLLSSSLFIDLFNMLGLCLTDDLLLAAIFGGLVKGFGLGLVYKPGGTTGGADIGARMLRRRYPYINFGTLSLALDAAVVICYAISVQKLDAAMYTVITMFVSSRVVNLVLYGAMNSSVCYIITIKPREIAEAVGESLHRGATLLKAEGAYTGEERFVVLCVIRRREIAEVKKIIHRIDSRSFVIVTSSHEIFGKNFSNIASQD